ncbi:hypothetical protein MY526_18790, partial [Geodermatophilus sp. CPCC 205761]
MTRQPALLERPGTDREPAAPVLPRPRAVPAAETTGSLPAAAVPAPADGDADAVAAPAAKRRRRV